MMLLTIDRENIGDYYALRRVLKDNDVDYETFNSPESFYVKFKVKSEGFNKEMLNRRRLNNEQT